MTAVRPIVAVTDFRNITGNAEDDWLDTGISETVSADLSGFEGVTVIPRARVHERLRTLGHETAETGEGLRLRAGRELGARWVLTGSFQRSGDTVRVTASLIDVPTGRVARERSRSTASSTRSSRCRTGWSTTSPRACAPCCAGPVAPPRQETGLVGAYEAFSKGVLNLRAETYESLDRAVMLFERAVELDPRYARAHLELGVAYATKADYLAMGELRARAEALASAGRSRCSRISSVRGASSDRVLIATGQESEGFDALRRALDLDASDAGALAAMGRALFIGRARFAEAASWYDRAIDANPSGGWYALQLSHCAALLRDFPRGEAAGRRAMALQEAFLSGQEGVHIVGAAMRLGHLDALQGRHASGDRLVHARARAAERRRSRAAQPDARRAERAPRAARRSRSDARARATRCSTSRSRASIDASAWARTSRSRATTPPRRTRSRATPTRRWRSSNVPRPTRRAFTLARARIEPEFESLRKDERFQRLLGTLPR